MPKILEHKSQHTSIIDDLRIKSILKYHMRYSHSVERIDAAKTMSSNRLYLLTFYIGNNIVVSYCV